MSKAFLIVLLILVVLFLLLYPFLGALIKDKKELAGITLEEKFPFFFKTISEGLFAGKGKIYQFPDNPRAANMMSSDQNCQNMIVHFLYSTGNMIIELGFKYYQQELRFQHTAYNLRDGSVFVQKDLGNAFVEIALRRIYEHKLKVTKLLRPEEVVNNISQDKPFDDKDGIDIVQDSYSGLSIEQKESIICFGYLVATANGDPEYLFTANPVVLQQLRFLNVSWQNCKGLLASKGESGICKLLVGIDESIIVLSEAYFSACCISPDNGKEDPTKVAKLHECISAIGMNPAEYDELVLKNRLLLQKLFGE